MDPPGGSGTLIPMHSVILLPGLACDAAVWQAQVLALGPHCRVVVSDVHFRFDTLPAMAAALRAEHPGSQVLVGCSMGGMLALEMQRQAPQQVAAMALLGSSARADTPELIRLRSDAIVLFEQGRMDEVLRANVLFAFHPHSQRRRDLVERYLQMVGRADATALVRQNRAVMARIDSRPLLHEVACPVLVACGDADQLTPVAHSVEMAESIPGSRLAVVSGAGHMLTMEQPERVNALLLDWLASLR
jgi:pimeloyl-ACP methyl ester carboxylesterase